MDEIISKIKEDESVSRKIRAQHLTIRILMLIISMMTFFVSIEMMCSSFKFLGKALAQDLITATQNPFVGLFIGLLSTSIIQSSSTTTAMIVAMVATGTISFENAIPMVMGANVGTTITSTIVSLGHVARKKEFRRAIAAATAHDFFNILLTLIVFPLEFFFGFLQKITLWITNTIGLKAGTETGWNDWFLRKFADQLAQWFGQFDPLVSVIVSVSLLYLTILAFSTQLKILFIGNFYRGFHNVIFGTPIQSLLWGIFITAIIQSSSVVTSLTVPLVATHKVTLKKVFPFLMGANLGTTVTAIIAALYKTDAAIQIAVVHFIFNFIGILIFFPIPAIRFIPTELAKKLGEASLNNRLIGFLYILILFFLLPFILIFSSIHF